MSMKVCYAGYPVVRTGVPEMPINVPGERPVFKMANSHYRPRLCENARSFFQSGREASTQ
jgi:hypothetical protein